MITIKSINDSLFEVTVEEASTTTHQVSVSDEYFQKLVGAGASKEKLIEESFKFLLERESNTMILSEFDLPVIQRYFPEYESEIKKVVAS